MRQTVLNLSCVVQVSLDSGEIWCFDFTALNEMPERSNSISVALRKSDRIAVDQQAVYF